MPSENEMQDSAISVDEAEARGILINFTVPAKTEQMFVAIKGIGTVGQRGTYDGLAVGKDDYFFYPFVEAGKTYDVLIKFTLDVLDSEGYATKTDYLGWKLLKVTAKGGSGEARVTKQPDLNISATGDFTITPPEFSNTAPIAGWYIRVASFAGRSWNNPSGQRSKWLNNYEIKDLSATYNLYLIDSWWADESAAIGFLSVDPRIKYKDFKGREWEYRWNDVLKDSVNLPARNDAWKTATMADLPKLKGTWRCNGSGIFVFGDNGEYEFPYVYQDTITITDDEIKIEKEGVITKEGGDAFTTEEKAAINKGSGWTFSSDDKQAHSTYTETHSLSNDSTPIKSGKIKLFINGGRFRYYPYNNSDFYDIYAKQ